MNRVRQWFLFFSASSWYVKTAIVVAVFVTLSMLGYWLFPSVNNTALDDDNCYTREYKPAFSFDYVDKETYCEVEKNK